MHKRPEQLVNDTIDALTHLSPAFEREAMKVSYRNALIGALVDGVYRYAESRKFYRTFLYIIFSRV